MKKNIVALFILFLSIKSYSQCIEIRSDTLTIYQLDRVDAVTKSITSSFTFFSIDSNLYDGLNFPFFCFNCEESAYIKNNLFLIDYKPLTDEKSLNKFYTSFKKKKSVYANAQMINLPIPDFLQCLNIEYEGKFLIKEQKMVAIFFVTKCKAKRGIHDGLFCEQLLNLQEIPVILKVEKLL